MTDTQPAPTDPRIAPLLELVQGLITEHGRVAASVVTHLPEEARAEFINHTQTVVQEAVDRVAEIASWTPRVPVNQPT